MGETLDHSVSDVAGFSVDVVPSFFSKVELVVVFEVGSFFIDIFELEFFVVGGFVGTVSGGMARS